MVNKLLVDLSNAQKKQMQRNPKTLNKEFANTKIDKLKATNLELSTASKNFQDLNEEMAKENLILFHN